jgi:GT2 family glycosyltransferase
LRPIPRTGAVAIGRNEGERLRACLLSLVGRVEHIVYVDSGSTDGSTALAKGLGVEVVDLDMSIPFTAARARNEGWKKLHRDHPEIELVQFVDGDCEVVEGWIEAAHAAIGKRVELAAVCGRRRERHPDASIYNRLCDIEWDTPIGETDACGGDAMMRMAALVEVGGFDPTVIAGEEPELCVRLRRAGWKIERLELEMTMHDAAMTHFAQWWKRSVRAGHSFAEGSHKHGASPEHHWRAESRRIWFWGAVLPAFAIGGAVPTLGLSLGLLAGYPVSAYRAYRAAKRRGRSEEEALLYGIACTVGKFPEVVGAARFHWGRTLGRRSGLIEYKR